MVKVLLLGVSEFTFWMYRLNMQNPWATRKRQPGNSSGSKHGSLQTAILKYGDVAKGQLSNFGFRSV